MRTSSNRTMNRCQKLNVQSHILQSETSKLPIGLGGSNFSKRIISKYGVLRKSGRLPALIYARLFGIRGGNTQTIHNHKSLYNNYFRFYLNLNATILNLSLKLIKQLTKTLSYRQQNQAPYKLGMYSKDNLLQNTFQNFIDFLWTPMHEVHSYPIHPFLAHRSQNVEKTLQPRTIITSFYNLIPSSYKAHPDTFKQLFFYIKSQSYRQDGETKKIFNEKKTEKNIVFPGLFTPALNSISPATLSYFQKTFNVKNVSPKFDKALHVLPALKQRFHAEYTPLVQKRTIQNTRHENIFNEDRETNNDIVYPGLFTTTLNSISPATLSYFQKNVIVKNANSKYDKALHVLPDVKQRFHGEYTPFMQKRTIQNIKYGNIFNENIETNNNIVYPGLFTTTLNSISPATLSYFQKNVIVKNANSKFDKAFHVLPALKQRYHGEYTPLMQNRAIQNIKYENIFNEDRETNNNIVYPGLVTTTLNSISPATLSYFQKIFNVKNVSSKFNKALYVLPALKQRFHGEYTPLMQNRAIQNIKDENIFNEDRETNNNIVYPGLVTTTLNSISPATLSYFQKIFNVKNVSSKFNKALYVLPDVKQQLNAKKHSTNQNSIHKSTDSTLLQHYIQNIGYGSKAGKEAGKNIVFPISYHIAGSTKTVLGSFAPNTVSYLQRVFDSNNFSSGLHSVINPLTFETQHLDSVRYSFEVSEVSPIKILSRYLKAMVPVWADTPLLQQNMAIKNAVHERIYKKSDGTGNEISFVIPPLGGSVKQDLNSQNPSIYSHLQRTVNVKNTRSKMNKSIHLPGSSKQPFHAEHHFLALSHLQLMNRLATNKNGGTKRWNVIHAFHSGKKTSVDGTDGTNVLPYDSTDLVLRKAVIQKPNDVSDNIDHLQREKTSPAKMNNNLVQESFKEIPISEISMIADKVYTIIERKISIEKDRRGMF
jgi:hypothetical protein